MARPAGWERCGTLPPPTTTCQVGRRPVEAGGAPPAQTEAAPGETATVRMIAPTIPRRAMVLVIADLHFDGWRCRPVLVGCGWWPRHTDIALSGRCPRAGAFLHSERTRYEDWWCDRCVARSLQDAYTRKRLALKRNSGASDLSGSMADRIARGPVPTDTYLASMAVHCRRMDHREMRGGTRLRADRHGDTVPTGTSWAWHHGHWRRLSSLQWRR